MSSKKCLTRVSHKSVKQELLNSVKQGCPTRVSPQCVNSGCLTNEFVGNVANKYCLCLSTYVSAFGFVGFILFSIKFGSEVARRRLEKTCVNNWLASPNEMNILHQNSTSNNMTTCLFGLGQKKGYSLSTAHLSRQKKPSTQGIDHDGGLSKS